MVPRVIDAAERFLGGATQGWTDTVVIRWTAKLRTSSWRGS